MGEIMDLKILQTYIRLAENGSFTQTAQELNYAQSTVTMQIQQLEKELGYRLFDRIGRTVSLTTMGQEFLGCAYEILQTLDRAMTLEKDPTHLHGTLRLGVLESLLFGTMLEILPQFRAKYPNVRLQITMGQTTDLIRQLKENKLDLVYLSAAENADPDLKSCYQRREELVFLCAPGHEARNCKTLEDLFQYDFVLTERSGICYNRLQQLVAACGSFVRSCMEVDSTIAISHAVRNELGLAFLPKYSVQSQLNDGTLVQISPEDSQQYYYSQILCHKNRWLSPFMEGLIQMISEKRPT